MKALKACFDELDVNKDGTIDAKEYQKEHLVISLLEELARAPQRLAEIFESWDKDGSGSLEKGEFRKALRGLHLRAAEGCSDADMDRAFSALDADGSGSLTFAELNQQLGMLLAHDGGRHVAIRTKLRGHATKAAGAALPPSVVIRAGPDALDQLRSVMKQQLQKVVNLFHEWDTDGDGRVTRKEFRKAMALLSFEAPRATVDSLFDSIDADGSGYIEYKELVKALKRAPTAPLSTSKENAGANSTPASHSKELASEVDKCRDALLQALGGAHLAGLEQLGTEGAYAAAQGANPLARPPMTALPCTVDLALTLSSPPKDTIRPKTIRSTPFGEQGGGRRRGAGGGG